MDLFDDLPLTLLGIAMLGIIGTALVARVSGSLRFAVVALLAGMLASLCGMVGSLLHFGWGIDGRTGLGIFAATMTVQAVVVVFFSCRLRARRRGVVRGGSP